jgi:ribosomal protein L16/L10AE
MTEMANKKGHMKLTVEVEVNEELMDVAKEAMSKMSTKLPEIMRRGNQEKQE